MREGDGIALFTFYDAGVSHDPVPVQLVVLMMVRIDIVIDCLGMAV